MQRDIVPVGPLLRELVLAVGAALAIANLVVVVRERRRPPDDPGPRPNMTVVLVNLLIGTVMAVWGLASLLAGGGGG